MVKIFKSVDRIQDEVGAIREHARKEADERAGGYSG